MGQFNIIDIVIGIAVLKLSIHSRVTVWLSVSLGPGLASFWISPSVFPPKLSSLVWSQSPVSAILTAVKVLTAVKMALTGRYSRQNTCKVWQFRDYHTRSQLISLSSTIYPKAQHSPELCLRLSLTFRLIYWRMKENFTKLRKLRTKTHPPFSVSAVVYSACVTQFSRDVVT